MRKNSLSIGMIVKYASGIIVAVVIVLFMGAEENHSRLKEISEIDIRMSRLLLAERYIEMGRRAFADKSSPIFIFLSI